MANKDSFLAIHSVLIGVKRIVRLPYHINLRRLRPNIYSHIQC